jgi:copper resistance protein C
MPTRLPLALLFLAFAATAFRPAEATAHAIVAASSPEPRQTVTKGELSIAVRFNSRIDRARSRLVLMRPDGSPQALALKETGVGESLEAEAKGLEKGAYRLLWQALSVDGHVTHGEIPFEVDR